MDTPIQKLDLIHWITELDDFSYQGNRIKISYPYNPEG
jgi:hypothetical protein